MYSNSENFYNNTTANKRPMGTSTNLSMRNHSSKVPINNQVPQNNTYDKQQFNNKLTKEPLQPFLLNTNYYGNAGANHNVVSKPGPSHVFLPTSNNHFSESLNTKEQESKIQKSTTPARKGNENIRVFTGTPEKIMKWHKMYKDYFCFYEVIGSIVSIQEGTIRLQKIMLLRDKKGPILQLVHYVHDHIDIENFFVGQMLRCVGRMIGPNIMHGLSIREAKPDEITALQRMCYISDHAITKSKKIQ